MKAVWNDTIIAESDDTVVVEGNHYFPIGSVKPGLLKPSARTSVCPWKGTATYFTIQAGGAENPDAVWQYESPKEAAANIKGRVAFWKGVTVA
ncbi:DUF427 domain-containing protein [Lichenihabitans psoromatis]|uniref:DUF427 domain-containing protein n=1 Tax=Lichenihabitans psoromatis TaxID=2528642 RepID=UPI0010383361|nr:DUF427 domain-containing protein [Lichenihabitans psoromatis]